MNLIARINAFLLYPLARTIVGLQSIAQRFRTMRQTPDIHFEAAYEGQPVLLLALYQKGALRPDLFRLLRAAKAQNIYVLGVNTLKLLDPKALEGLVDCYIERPNFGRDFGSYQTGFLHLQSRKWQTRCPRLLMLNDSVFYSTLGLDKFIADLVASDVEVLGATENFEVEYHLGSFAIALSGDILKADRFQKYWQDYKLTDVRPLVIKRGEMKLSRTLKRCASTSSHFSALYSSVRFLNEIKQSPALQDLVIKDSRTSLITPCPRFEIGKVAELLKGRYISERFDLGKKIEINVDTPIQELTEEFVISNRDDLWKYLLRNVISDTQDFEEIFSDSFAAVAAETFMTGSQIHQNAAILLEIGLPIVKLDGIYRGLLNAYDLLQIEKKLARDEAYEVTALLLERPYGGNVLVGWRRAAFFRGLI